MALLIDEAMEKYGSANWNYNERTKEDGPLASSKSVTDIEEPINVREFISGALRPVGDAKKGRMLLDISTGVAEFSIGNGEGNQGPSVFQKIKERRFNELPDGLRPANPLPADMKLGCIVQNHQDGTCTGLKVLQSDKQVSIKSMSAYATGTPYAPLWQEGRIHRIQTYSTLGL